MRGQERIDQMYAFVVVDTDGTEGVPAVSVGGMALPLVGADRARMDSMLEPAQDVADKLGKRVEMVTYKDREHVRWLDPRAKVDLCVNCAQPVVHGTGVAGATAPTHVLCPKPPAEPGRTGFVQFDEPQLADTSTTIEARGVIVAGLLIDGKPGIQITYLVGDHALPGITVVGEQAEDLVRLATDALASAKQAES